MRDELALSDVSLLYSIAPRNPPGLRLLRCTVQGMVSCTNHSFTNLANLLTGDSFGELSVAGVRIRPTTAIAVSDSLLIKINYSAWQVAEKASLGICLTSAKFSTQAKFNLIRTVDFLRSWNMSKQYRFVTYLGTEEFPKGFTLLRANRPSTHLYFVASGELGVVEHSSNKLLTKLTVSSINSISLKKNSNST